MECHKSINNPSNSLSRYFKAMVTRTTKSGENKMALPNLRTNQGRRAFSFRGPDHWDKLPADIKNIESLAVFKTEYVKRFNRDENHPT